MKENFVLHAVSCDEQVKYRCLTNTNYRRFLSARCDNAVSVLAACEEIRYMTELWWVSNGDTKRNIPRGKIVLKIYFYSFLFIHMDFYGNWKKKMVLFANYLFLKHHMRRMNNIPIRAGMKELCFFFNSARINSKLTVEYFIRSQFENKP